jgi:hypothetical protein
MATFRKSESARKKARRIFFTTEKGSDVFDLVEVVAESEEADKAMEKNVFPALSQFPRKCNLPSAKIVSSIFLDIR